MASSYKKIPTYNNDSKLWTETEFVERQDFVDFVLSLFKEPGQYEFDSTSFLFNAEARKFHKDKHFCFAPFGSKDFIKYWDDQKNKCRNGVIFQSGDKSWYLTRDYYMWINFLPIYDKVAKKYDFPQIWDSQYHMALYELLAELHFKHIVILKKRQFGSSYFHICKLLNQYWFEDGAVLKIGASLKDYINEKGSWKFLNEYRNFLNEHTAWYRHNEPDKVLSWKQQIKVRISGRDTYKGLGSSFTGMSFEKDPTNGVGGPVTYFFHEEAGIASKMDDTFGYLKPALKLGMITTGAFIAAGSVGDLSQCGPLKHYMYHPDDNDFYGVNSNLLDDKGNIQKIGLFIPEQWSMPPYIDQFGNSQVEEALKALDIYFESLKKRLEPAAYQLEISQHPRTLEEAFASREESIFPPHLVSQQIKRIEDKIYPVEYLELFYDEFGRVDAKNSRRIPIREFPLSAKSDNKEGVLCVWERPVPNAPWNTYIASVDPLGEGKSLTSNSLCSIIIYKNPIEVSKVDSNGVTSNYIEGDKIVASWCGRYDDLKNTHELLEKIIEWYNAWTLCEANVSQFINYMIFKKKQKYLVPKDQILFLKELHTNMTVYSDYGWKNTGTLFKSHLLSYGVQFTMEELDRETTEEGKLVKIIYGIERIPDPMILAEMSAYKSGLNVDRIVAYCALVAFAKIQLSNIGMRKRVEIKDDRPDNPGKISKLIVSPFRHMGGTKPAFSNMPKRSAFRNLK